MQDKPLTLVRFWSMRTFWKAYNFLNAFFLNLGPHPTWIWNFAPPYDLAQDHRIQLSANPTQQHYLISDNSWRAPSSSATIHNLPYWLRSFAKPDMTSQNWRKTLRRLVDSWIYRRNFLRRFCEAMSGFAKLLSPEDKCGMCYYCLQHFT